MPFPNGRQNIALFDEPVVCRTLEVHSRRTLMTAERTASLNCGKMPTVVMLLARRPAEPSPGGDKSHPDDEHLAAVPLSSISRTFK